MLSQIVETVRQKLEITSPLEAELYSRPPKPMVLSLWFPAYGPRPMAYGLWPMAYGPWPMAHGLWPMAYGP